MLSVNLREDIVSEGFMWLQAASVKVHVQFPQGLHRSRRIIARNSKLLDQLEAHLNECGDSCEVQDLISIARRQVDKQFEYFCLSFCCIQQGERDEFVC